MKKYLEKMGFKFDDDKVDSVEPEPVKTKEQLDIDKMVKFAGKMKDISNQLDKCSSLKSSLIQTEDDPYFFRSSYTGGWRIYENDLKFVGIDVDEFYASIYSKVKEKEAELKAQLKEYTEGCVKCDITPTEV